MAVICEMSCGRGRAEDCRPPPLCGAVISPPEHKTTRVNLSIRINSVQRVNSGYCSRYTVDTAVDTISRDIYTDWSVPVVTTVLMMYSPDPDPPTLTNTLMQHCVATGSWTGGWCSTDGKVATIHQQLDQLRPRAPPPL